MDANEGAISALLLHFEPTATTLKIRSCVAVVAVVVGVNVNYPAAAPAAASIVSFVVPLILLVITLGADDAARPFPSHTTIGQKRGRKNFFPIFVHCDESPVVYWLHHYVFCVFILVFFFSYLSQDRYSRK